MSYWGDSAINAFVNLTPSSPWAVKVAEQWKGLPFGKYLHQSPPRRQRTLTGPVDPSQHSLWHRLQIFSNVSTSQHTLEQTHSPFFSRLPLDIRIIIYELVLGGMVFHIESATPQSRIYHLICNRPLAIDEPNHQCHELTTQRPSSAPRDDYQEASGLLPLLVTCRRAYSECVGTLYSANTFQFTSNHAAFRLLKVMVPPQRLRSLRHFRMVMRLPHHPHMNSRSKRDWAALWEFFAGEMVGLQSLYLKLLMLHDTQEQVRRTEDAEGAEWIWPMVGMAAAVSRTRGCRVEVMTGGEVQDLGRMLKETASADVAVNDAALVRSVCVQVHRRMRISLGGGG
ncbi:hypothetical protein LTR35_014437 [Friedmanniomyces endolithicus]|nr:hypothetical protein LTR35_014437 [Friedmanniomyces endolithicus]KAK0279321.1 hypothetical protein LTS00_013426 [Friedmanniomyces endolithicus]KAK0988723.1 hypothetical protein LTR54_012683 [Friedmanniomyces endolithicus]